MNKIFLLLLLSLAMLSCQNDKVFRTNRLDGDWDIVRSQRLQIFEDGSTELFEDLENAGTMSIYEPTPSSQTLKEFTFQYVNFRGESVTFSSLIFSDEAGSRVFMAGVLCNDVFDCDLVWTVEEDRLNKQVWSAYGNEDAFFWPPDQYDPSDDSFHMKWTIELRRQ